MDWKPVSQQRPPANTDILILVRGRVFEGQLHSVRLMGFDEPHEFESVYTHDRGMQHSDWGPGAWWSPRPRVIPQWSAIDAKCELRS